MIFLAFFLIFLVLFCEWKVCVKGKSVGNLWVSCVDKCRMMIV